MAGELGTNSSTLSPKTLVAQTNYGPVLMAGTVTGGNFAKGQVLGIITASGKYTDYDDAAVDGSETAVAVLAEDADATSADVIAQVILVGVLVEANLTGLDANGKADLAAKGFFFK